mmetsp:Transcript_18753/g.45069  ORF Transcript_18753/g.45069 Transcript_18753/m.45069 type:complete len:133 (+) Transcript_18753:167-565(+)
MTIIHPRSIPRYEPTRHNNSFQRRLRLRMPITRRRHAERALRSSRHRSKCRRGQVGWCHRWQEEKKKKKQKNAATQEDDAANGAPVASEDDGLPKLSFFERAAILKSAADSAKPFTQNAMVTPDQIDFGDHH